MIDSGDGGEQIPMLSSGTVYPSTNQMELTTVYINPSRDPDWVTSGRFQSLWLSITYSSVVSVELLHDVEVRVDETDDFSAVVSHYQSGVYDGIVCDRVASPGVMEYFKCKHVITANYVAVFIDSDQVASLVMCEVMPVGKKGNSKFPRHSV